jgi:glycosyltransferase involved in cell wall biosynthesis
MPWHNLPLLVRAFEALRSRGHAARLLLVGDGLAWDEVARTVGASAFRRDIEMAGFADGDELVRHKARIDVAVLPGTRWYNLPTKIFEYGAAGTAAIAPRSPTVESMFRDGQDLLLFEEGNLGSLTECLSLLVKEAPARVRLGANLQELVTARHTSAHAERFYSNLFDRLCVVS